MRLFGFAVCLFFFLSACIYGFELSVSDLPDDDGTALIISWSKLPPETLKDINADRFLLERKAMSDSYFTPLAFVSSQDTIYIDKGLTSKQKYFYRLSLIDPSLSWRSDIAGPFSPKENWFNTKRANVLVGILLIGFLVGLYIYLGKRGKKLYLRPIAGLTALDEALGRAAEMGKPVLYSSGRGRMERPASIASMNILGLVAEKIAAYDVPLVFPNNDPVVTAVAQEVVKEGYVKAGKPEAYRSDNIYFVTESQFGYAAAVDGIMLRQKPAANLFFGTFEAESLILAETGNSIGAIQIAGTDSSIQLAFFIIACDYVLIGEELFAASGYLSGDSQIVGSLKGSDISKIIIIFLLIVGAFLAVLNQTWFADIFITG